MKRLSSTFLLCLAALLIASSPASASDDSGTDPALISVAIENGVSSMDTLEFSGMCEDSIKPCASEL